MRSARVSEPAEQWIELPTPNLGRYLLHTRHRAANDNRPMLVESLPVLPIGACVALSGTLMLLVTLFR